MERSNPLKAAAWMMGAVVGFAVVVLVIRRSDRGFAQIRSARLLLHLKRNLFHYIGQNLWFYAVVLIPLNQLVALEFTNPIWVALLAPFLLGERLTRTRIAGALLGFLGVLIVAQPGSATLGLGHAAALSSAVFFALNTIFTKQIMRHDSVLCVMFWMTLLQGGASLLLSLPRGIPAPSAATAPWLLVVGLTGLSAHYSLTSALGHAPATIVAPMEFVRLPLIALVGMWVYGEPLRLAIFVGAGLIIAGNLINLRIETRRVPA